MPMYEYACDTCNHRFEIEQSMRDNPLTECPECGNRLRRVFGLSSVIFKGNGFYCTDSKPSGTSEKPACANCPASAPS